MSSTETMKTWSDVIKCFEDVPIAFADGFKSILVSESLFPYTVYIPPQKLDGYNSGAQLVSLFSERVVFLEMTKAEGIKVAEHYFKDIDYIENGRILLHSWLNVEGISNGRSQNSIIHYNSASSSLFIPIAEKIRESIIPFEEYDVQSEREKINARILNDFMYINYGKNSIHEGEKVIDTLFQETICTVRDFVVLKRYNLITSAHMCILTDKELIIIKDPPYRRGNYGCIVTYIPRGRIQTLTLSSNEDSNIFILEIHLVNGVKKKLIFASMQKKRVEGLLHAFAGAVPRDENRTAQCYK